MTDGILNRLAQERDSRGLTQDQLAARSGIGQSKLSKYETGKHFPSSGSIEAIAGALGVTGSTVYEWLTTPATAAAPEPASEAETLDMPAVQRS